MNHEHNAYLVLPRLRVQNYNLISSPLTWGAPAITGVTGFMHALQRQIPFDWGIDFLSVGLVMHEFEPQVNGRFEKRFNLTRNPPVAFRGHRKNIRGNGEARVSAIIEEGRAHGTISLVFGIYLNEGISSDELHLRASEINQIAQTLRFVGGSFLPQKASWHQPQILSFGGAETELEYLDWGPNQEAEVRKLKNSLLPGFALLGQDELFKAHAEKLKQKNPTATNLDALLDISRINYSYRKDEEGKASWQASRQAGDGWLVPIPVGFTSLSELYEPGQVVNARDPSVGFRFVESLYSVGEWRSPHRLVLLQDLLWRPVSDHQQGIYRCIN